MLKYSLLCNWKLFFSNKVLVKEKSVFLQPQMRDVSPVGSERCLHTAEVTGSSPVRPTKKQLLRKLFFFMLDLFYRIQVGL